MILSYFLTASSYYFLYVSIISGEIWLDETYDSGVPNCPGTRFVIDLKVPPLRVDESVESSLAETEDMTMEELADPGLCQQQQQQELPPTLSVLIVDDEMILRKLFNRSIKKALPSAIVTEASNGETALRFVDEGQKFDLIFMDQYMSGVERCMLGTEAVRALRASGVECIITGLSANDLESAFIDAGANAFTMKPFPCKPQALKAELLRIWNSGNHLKIGFQDSFETSVNIS
jgi:CheY-like chemotaxis protein